MYDVLIDIFKSYPNNRIEIAKDAYLCHQNDTVHSIYIVEDGLIELTRFQEDGNSIVLQRAGSRAVLAEASLYSSTYHCNAIARLPSILYRAPKAAFKQRLEDDKSLSEMWSAHLAHEIQFSRYRLEILSRKTVAERLDGWLASRNGVMPEKGSWKAVAAQIGVSPEALYRELAKRSKARGH